MKPAEKSSSEIAHWKVTFIKFCSADSYENDIEFKRFMRLMFSLRDQNAISILKKDANLGFDFCCIKFKLKQNILGDYNEVLIKDVRS